MGARDWWMTAREGPGLLPGVVALEIVFWDVSRLCRSVVDRLLLAALGDRVVETKLCSERVDVCTRITPRLVLLWTSLCRL